MIASRYRLEARLGSGAMGTVYRARHLEVGRAFAIKILHHRLRGDTRTRRRFEREAALAGTLRHPNVVSVLDAGELAEGQRYIVMEYAGGETLYDLIVRDAPMPAARVLPLVRQLCSGLHHAHDLGLIHRDFKPENVIVERDRRGAEIPRIVDFGVAILRDEVAVTGPGRLTSAGVVLGTPRYMAPEQASGSPIDHRVDLFALGVTCFEMLTGRSPFDGDNADVVRANVLRETPAMRDRAPGLAVDPLLEAFTRALLMKSREARPATAEDAGALIDLIEHDRARAAVALGVMPEGTAPVVLVLVPPGVRPADAMVDPASHGLVAPPERVVAQRPSRGRARGVGLVSGLAAMAVFTAMAMALGGYQAASRDAAIASPGSPDGSGRAGPAPPGAVIAPVAPSPRPAGADVVVEGRAAAPAPARKLAKRVLAPPGTPAGPPITAVPSSSGCPPVSPLPAPGSSPPPPPSPSPSPDTPLDGAGLAHLYERVGRRLNALKQTPSASLAVDLLPTYLRLRIQDALIDPVKRDEASAVLRRLDDEIARALPAVEPPPAPSSGP
ncbi:MAG TPA: serine/threonine-protein kinase [Kofleriaceae bacterium]|nr:serine/threonine-protein kinase [Kofleriaceae bacterium]